MGKPASNKWWDEHFESAGKSKGFDYVSRDGTTAVEVQQQPQGLRGLYAGVMRLALAVEEQPKLKRACLVIEPGRLSMDRLRIEWENIRQLFQSKIAQRLSFVALSGTMTWIDPEEPFIRKIAESFQNNAVLDSSGQQIQLKSIAGRLYFETVKVLLIQWLRNQGPISIGQLAKTVGSTYPTVREALHRLDAKKYLTRESNRSVQLSRFPQEAWREMLALAPRMRQPFRFMDASGEKPDPHRLFKRLNQNRPKDVAWGGVSAARFWHPEFDLHGTPRIDVVVHSPNGVIDLQFVKKLDPALKQTSDPDESVVMVIHPLIRAAPLFTKPAKDQLPYADQIETALDLHELGLENQADELLAHFRKEVRRP